MNPYSLSLLLIPKSHLLTILLQLKDSKDIYHLISNYICPDEWKIGHLNFNQCFNDNAHYCRLCKDTEDVERTRPDYIISIGKASGECTT